MAQAQEALALGVEEEFQIVDEKTTELVSGFETMMRYATADIEAHMKAEFLQCVIEGITDVCTDITMARQQTMRNRATAAAMAKNNKLAIIAAGTHPTSPWYHQKRSAGDRYKELEEKIQEVARSILIWGLHVHVDIPDLALRVKVMNYARTYLPHILALSANSPFWLGRYTGYMSYRTIVWAGFPFAGTPDAFATVEDYQDFYALLQETNTVGKIRRLWWDLRPHHTLPTLEFRVADMPMNHADTMAIIAFIQALVKTIMWRIDRGETMPILTTTQVEENRFRAARWGSRGKFIDYARRCEVPAIEALAEAVEMIAPAAIALGAEHELKQLRTMTTPGFRSGSERQIDAFMRHQDPCDVNRLLMHETLRDIDPRMAMPLAHPEKGKR